MTYNPDERKEMPRIGIPRIGIGKVPFINVFGEVDKAYVIEDNPEPCLLWDNGSPMLWEDKSNVLLEQQKVRIWLRKARKSAK